MSAISKALIFSQPAVNVTLLIQASSVHPSGSLGKQALQGAPEVSKTGTVRQIKYDQKVAESLWFSNKSYIVASRNMNMWCNEAFCVQLASGPLAIQLFIAL